METSHAIGRTDQPFQSVLGPEADAEFRAIMREGFEERAREEREKNRGTRSFRPIVRLRDGIPCTLKKHFLGCLRQVIGLAELLAAKDPERFIWCSKSFLEHARKKDSSKYTIRHVRQSLLTAELRGILTSTKRMRNGVLRCGFIVADHDAIAESEGRYCVMSLPEPTRSMRRKQGQRRTSSSGLNQLEAPPNPALTTGPSQALAQTQVRPPGVLERTPLGYGAVLASVSAPETVSLTQPNQATLKESPVWIEPPFDLGSSAHNLRFEPPNSLPNSLPSSCETCPSSSRSSSRSSSQTPPEFIPEHIPEHMTKSSEPLAGKEDNDKAAPVSASVLAPETVGLTQSAQSTLKESPVSPVEPSKNQTQAPSPSLSFDDFDLDQTPQEGDDCGPATIGELLGNSKSIITDISDGEFDERALTRYLNGDLLAECCRLAVETLAAEPYRGRVTNARLMGLAMEKLRELHGLDAPRGWLPVMKKLRESPHTPSKRCAQQEEATSDSDAKRFAEPVPPCDVFTEFRSSLLVIDPEAAETLNKQPETKATFVHLAEQKGVPRNWMDAYEFMLALDLSSLPPEAIRIRHRLAEQVTYWEAEEGEDPRFTALRKAAVAELSGEEVELTEAPQEVTNSPSVVTREPA